MKDLFDILVVLGIILTNYSCWRVLVQIARLSRIEARHRASISVASCHLKEVVRDLLREDAKIRSRKIRLRTQVDEADSVQRSLEETMRRIKTSKHDQQYPNRDQHLNAKFIRNVQ